MQDRESAWDLLRSGKPITPQHSEASLDTFFDERVLQPGSISPEDKRVLLNLANALQQNHHDSWLKDFLGAPFSKKANEFLESAISHRDSDAGQSLRDARAAENLYLQAGNIAGAARSQTEIIYAQRRLSHSAACVQEISKLKQRIAQLGYTSFQILADYESTNCQTMLSNFDLGRRFAEQTNAEAERANYPSLKLRALGLLSSLDWAEGRYQAAFNADAAGLALYWEGAYEGKRGFQFYSDSALTAEQAGLWHLAAILQQEALASLAGTKLLDFQATAHFHRAISLRRAGDPIRAQQEFNAAYGLFDNMQNPFLLADSEVDLAEVEIEQGHLSSAQTLLEKASSPMEQADSFLVRLSYYNTLANLERHRKQPDQEWKYLRKTIAIAKQGFTNLHSIENRWEWYQEVDHSFHRLVELELEVKHDPAQALADWETYRAAEIAPARLTPESKVSRDLLFSRLKGLQSSTLVSFIIFPKKVIILVADDHGIRPFTVAVDSETLQHEAENFLRLCSDPTSSLEKVNQAGSRLYKRLLQPVQKELAPDRWLAIEADGFLSRIPWPALVAEDGKYLDEKYMTVSTPGLFFFTAAGQARRKAPGSRLVAYPGAAEFEGRAYPPLPHAKEEAEYVAHLQPGSPYLHEDEVTSDELARQLPRASSFHFAGHAASREHGGELLLSGKDQTLSASAIRRLDLRGMNLVVLSACSTAEADLDIARSPNGLVQAFLSAGAKEVVASRWDVDSRGTFSFTQALYGEYRKRHDAAAAVSSAGTALRAQSRTAHPFYWASFQAFGH
ncbi:MAG TPA: CHAT domain-containing protein [Candidatus Angelobacter sp.]|nr:CHAT domain-containing protein [Candidatus Angelobacter sp.]